MIILGSLDDWKARIGFPIVLIELFRWVLTYGCGATSEYRFKIGDFA